jgi:hypothetical protein
MSKSPKQIVKEFHQANIINTELDFKDYFHEELVLIWNSADGLSIMNYDDLIAFFRRLGEPMRIYE